MNSVSLIIAATFLVGTQVHAQSINFDDLQRKGAPQIRTVTIDGLAAEGKSYKARFSSTDSSREQAREARRSSRGSEVSGSSDRNPSGGGGWKLVKQYTGGFADFGFDKQYQISVLKCGNGKEPRIYRHENGKWMGLGIFGGGNLGSNFEMAASNACK